MSAADVEVCSRVGRDCVKRQAQAISSGLTGGICATNLLDRNRDEKLDQIIYATKSWVEDGK